MKAFIIRKIERVYRFQLDGMPRNTPSGRKYHYLAFQEGGIYEHRMKDRNLIARPGMLLFLHKDESYTVSAQQTGPCICMVFEGEVEIPSFVCDCGSDAYLKNLFVKMLQHNNLENESCYYICMSAAYEIVALGRKAMASVYTAAETRSRLHVAQNYIQEHFREGDITNDMLAAMCGLGKRHFITLFKNEFRMTPAQYVIQKRLDDAVLLLNSQMYTISQIAEMTGFGDVYYFSKTFKKHMGVSPGRFAGLRPDPYKQ